MSSPSLDVGAVLRVLTLPLTSQGGRDGSGRDIW